MVAIARRILITGVATMVLVLVSAAATDAVAQTPQSTAAAELVMENPKNMNPDAAKVWNSPQMLRARAWLYDRISKSAKITPAEGTRYIKVLENMTADEMKLWLMKFEEQEEHQQQQYAFWQQSQQALAQRGMAANRAATQAEANINKAETASAIQEQGQLNEQAQARQDRSFENQFAPSGPYPYSPLGGYGFNPGSYYNPAYGGGVHYHYHYYQ